MKAFAEFVGMMNQYSDPALLVDGTYDQQVAGFKDGKYAFITQGNWCVTSPDDELLLTRRTRRWTTARHGASMSHP